MYHTLSHLWKELLQAGMQEDGLPWDWTTLGVRLSADQKLKAHLVAKSDGVWAAESLVKSLPSMGSSIQAQSLIQDGARYKSGQILVTMEGSASDLLALERPFLNLAAYVGGIASSTRRLVDQVQLVCPNQTPRVTLTRKTLPGYRDLSIHGVRVGGGYPHRVSLSGGVLIKENHIAAAAGIGNAIRGVKQAAPHGLKIEVEVQNQAELKEALEAGAEGVLLDNFTPDEVRAAVQYSKTTHSSVFIEVSGGLNERNISQYAITGVDILSVGSITHSIQSVDLSFLVEVSPVDG